MDLSDVEMEPEEHPPQPQQQQQPQPAAAGGGWGMLSRARGLLEEGQPSQALQAVRTLAPSLSSPLPLRLHLLCFVASRPSPFVPEREIRQVIETCLTRPSSINSIRTNAAGCRRFDFAFTSSSPWRNPPRDFARSEKTGFRWGDSF